MKVIAFGEILFDVYPDKAVIGGAPFNFCAHLSHLGATAYLVSAVAADDLGASAMREMHRHGVRSDLIAIDSHPTGRCNVTLDENRVPEYEIRTGVAYDFLQATDGVIERIRELDADVFYFNTLIQRSSVSRASLKRILATCRFRDVFCDVNLRKGCFDRESLLCCLTHATFLKVSEEEAHFLPELGLVPSGKDIFCAPELICKTYPNVRLCILTRGENGSAVFEGQTGRLYRSEIPRGIRVVSTVGAGDCYGATFLLAVLNGATIPEAIRAATERSNVVVAHKEAVPF